MYEKLRHTVDEVARAIDNLNRAFENQVSESQRAKNADELNRWVKAAQAMQDSGNIYLTWARHYASLNDPEGDDDESFLDEGSPIVR